MTALAAALALSIVSQLQAPGTRASAQAGADGSARPPRPFEVYRGLEARKVVSKSVVASARSRYELEPVLQGDLVRHDFLIPNDGAESIALRNIRMCSNCILGSYSETIPAGSRGHISLVVPTDALGGQEISGIISAETSDPRMPRLEIDVSLVVREFASLSPYRVWLEGRRSSEIVATSVIVPNEAYPFAITGIRARKGIWISFSHEEIEVGGRRAYEVTVRNTRGRAGPYQDVLFIQTDHPERPEFRLRVEGRIRD